MFPAPLSPHMMFFGLCVLEVGGSKMRDMGFSWPTPVVVTLAAKGQTSNLQGHPR